MVGGREDPIVSVSPDASGATVVVVRCSGSVRSLLAALGD